MAGQTLQIREEEEEEEGDLYWSYSAMDKEIILSRVPKNKNNTISEKNTNK